MRFKSKKEKYTEPYTRDGKTVQVSREREVQVPTLPRNWDRIGVRVVVGLVTVLTLAAITWSTWSIGELFQGGAGYIAAGVFDLAWAVSLVLTYLGRFDKKKREFSDNLGWWLLAATMGLIFWHGMEQGSVGMAVGGAAVSLFAKVLWLGVMKHVHRELSPEDQAWVQAEVSSANAMLAVADARRQAAQAEQRAALQLLAMERERAAMAEAYGLPVPDSAVATQAGALVSGESGASAGAPGAVAPQVSAGAGATAPAALPAAVPTADVAAIVAAVLAAQGGAPATAPGADATHDAEVIEDQDDTILPPLEPPTLSNLSKADAIRIALRKRPELQPAQISELLAGYEVQVSADYVRQVRNRDQEERTAAELGDASGEVVPIRREG
ncbi:hypothetical protein [Streptomyces sp. NBC_01314]|uniref:hypothetical protein n=1 Tax=Streptomyces sp. NBC_01314 TaxID=2903821 RepID=UPI003090F81A|nr:hypothetical protein OG622_50220 [Streptomyces sp. NBC_01314]